MWLRNQEVMVRFQVRAMLGLQARSPAVGVQEAADR